MTPWMDDHRQRPTSRYGSIPREWAFHDGLLANASEVVSRGPAFCDKSHDTVLPTCCRETASWANRNESRSDCLRRGIRRRIAKNSNEAR